MKHRIRSVLVNDLKSSLLHLFLLVVLRHVCRELLTLHPRLHIIVYVSFRQKSLIPSIKQKQALSAHIQNQSGEEFAKIKGYLIVMQNSIYEQIQITKMNKRDSMQLEDNNQNALNESEYLWTHHSVLTEKNSNSTLCFSPANHLCFSKKNYIANKTLNSKLHKMPLHQDENFLKIEQLATQLKGFNHFKRKSNIQILKKEIQYLQQETLVSQQFPRNDRCCQFFNKSGEDIGRKRESGSLRGGKGLTQSIKGLISETTKYSMPLSQQKLKRKWFKSKQKKPQIENKQNKQVKIFHKYQLIAPYRKYFPANRFRKNRSITMKVDEILGRRVTKLGNFTLQQEVR